MKRVVLAAVLVGVWVAVAAPPTVAALAQTDLDAFMRQVLGKRDENWKRLQQFVLDERERMDVTGPQLGRILGSRRDYRWYIRDGFFVRSPLSIDGVTVGDVERRLAEDDYLRQVKARENPRATATATAAATPTPAPTAGTTDGRQTAAGEGGPASPQTAPMTFDGIVAQTRQPQFISTAYFLRFKFEQGKYVLVGREQFDGRSVLRIEYYPARLFTDTQDRAGRRSGAAASQRDRRQDVEVERLMNKNSLVTLWVEPSAKQIVKFMFDNVQTDFLPNSWLARLEDIKASMTMSQPFPDVWLPRDVDVFMSVMSALGQFDITYHLDYVDYQQAMTSGRIIRGGGQ